MNTDTQLIVSLGDVHEACDIVRSMPMPEGEVSRIREEAVMDVYTLLEQLALERACGMGDPADGG
jgi:hypothetical protein